MHKEILSAKQLFLFSRLKLFSRDFGLVGGTAIALHLGHRESIDFDLASIKEIKTLEIRKKILTFGKIEAVFVDNKNEYTVVVNGVKFTFFYYPFPVKFSQKIDSLVNMPDILSLAAMKAYALGRRAKWKDYVDLFFIVRKYDSIDPIIKKAKEIFKKEFNEKNFRAQLVYFKDVDYSEKIGYRPEHEIKDAEIKKGLLSYL